MAAATPVRFVDLPLEYQSRKAEYDAALAAVVGAGAFILGKQVGELEQKLAAAVGVRHGVACANGTDAMLLALRALGVKAGDEVVVPAFTFFATAEVVSQLGAVPVFVDIDMATYCLDAKLLEAAITPRTRAIIAVSLYGQMADFPAINAVAAKHRLPVIEDAAQSYGATQGGRTSCGVTTIATTSFFPTKPLGCWGDGGACFTDDEALARQLRLLRMHGDAGKYDHVIVGYNSRLDTLQAAVLLVKLAHFPADLAARQAAADRYTRLLAGVCPTPVVATGNTSAWAQYAVTVRDRAAVQTALQAAGIPTAVHYPKPLYRQTVYAGMKIDPARFPAAEAAARDLLCLPLHAFLTEDQQQTVAEALRQAPGVK